MNWGPKPLGRRITWLKTSVRLNASSMKMLGSRRYAAETTTGSRLSLSDLARYRSWSWKGAKKTTFGSLSRDEALARRDSVKADLDAFLRKSNADLAPLLQEALQPALGRIRGTEDARRPSRFSRFADQGSRSHSRQRERCVKSCSGASRHYFVDEFQDTDPIQAELLLLLSADNPDESNWLNVSPIPGKLFLVGDPKQSIYRFRRADIAIYLQVKQMLLSRGAEPLYLNTSFRSPPSLQSFVNAAFAPAMAGTTA